MTRSPPPIQRRRFLTAAGATGLAGLAGCSALTDNDQEQTTPQTQAGDDLQAESPEQVVESFLTSIAEEKRIQSQLFHSTVNRQFALESIETDVINEDPSESELGDEFQLRREQFEEIAADAELAIVEATLTFSENGETEDTQFEWLVATEDEAWRLVESRIIRSDSDSESGSGSDEESEPEPDPEMPDAVHEYMIDNDVQSYDGSLADKTGMESVTVDVGAGNQGLSFSPPVVRVDSGTEVVWEWTGEGGAHNVVSTDAPEEFSSEEVTGEAGHTWSYTFEETGTYFYSCEPHLAIGMHGAILVE